MPLEASKKVAPRSSHLAILTASAISRRSDAILPRLNSTIRATRQKQAKMSSKARTQMASLYSIFTLFGLAPSLHSNISDLSRLSPQNALAFQLYAIFHLRNIRSLGARLATFDIHPYVIVAAAAYSSVSTAAFRARLFASSSLAGARAERRARAPVRDLTAATCRRDLPPPPEHR